MYVLVWSIRYVTPQKNSKRCIGHSFCFLSLNPFEILKSEVAKSRNEDLWGWWAGSQIFEFPAVISSAFQTQWVVEPVQKQTVSFNNNKHNNLFSVQSKIWSLEVEETKKKRRMNQDYNGRLVDAVVKSKYQKTIVMEGTNSYYCQSESRPLSQSPKQNLVRRILYQILTHEERFPKQVTV